MNIIISPAKKMKVDCDSLTAPALPQFLEQAECLQDRLREMSYPQLKKLWQCNDTIAQCNYRRLQDMDLRRGLTPALLSYEGIQYRYMAPGVFSDGEFAYVQAHLRILSGFYGVLRPMDGVQPYRLEMQAKLAMPGCRDLYEFWGERLAKAVADDWVLNLASREYSRCVTAYAPVITCVFGQRLGGKLVEKGTLCKMARGEMVRFLAENRITDPAQVKEFSGLGYRFDVQESRQDTYVFIKEEP